MSNKEAEHLKSCYLACSPENLRDLFCGFARDLQWSLFSFSGPALRPPLSRYRVFLFQIGVLRETPLNAPYRADVSDDCSIQGGDIRGVSQVNPRLCRVWRCMGVLQLYCCKSRLNGSLSPFPRTQNLESSQKIREF